MTLLQTESVAVIIERSFGLAEEAAPFRNLEDGSPKAVAARKRYDQRRRQVLEAMDWNFARRRVVPSIRADLLAPETHPIALAVPQDCIRVRDVKTGTCRHPFLVEGDGIFTTWIEEGRTQVIFTGDAQLPVRFPPVFTQALEFLLAADWAMLYARSINRAGELRRAYQLAIEEASYQEAGEQSEDEVYADSEFSSFLKGENGSAPW